MLLKKYAPHDGQIAFHYAIENMWRFVAMICGIRGGKTYAGAREATRQCWNSKIDINIPYGIVAPTFHMLDRTTWREFKQAARPLILKENDSKKIITLKNGREVFGFSAEQPDKIRNVTLAGFWIDEARECKDLARLWDVLLGRVLSTNGKGIVTSSPNSFDDLHDIFIANKEEDYGTVRFSTYENTTITKEAIDSLASKYDDKFARQELYGDFVIFEGAVYYTFNRNQNAGNLAFEVANYNPLKPIGVCADFNVNPMAWVLTQFSEHDGLKTVNVIDEIYLGNSNTMECCQEFKNRYPNNTMGLDLFGDATGKARHTSSNVTNYQIIEDELRLYNVTNRVPRSNTAERDRVNAMNGVICNSKEQRRLFINPNKCKHLINDLEQVSYKDGSTQIDKTRDLRLTHASDALGYMVESEFSLNRREIRGISI